jgi:hypothetical protein
MPPTVVERLQCHVKHRHFSAKEFKIVDFMKEKKA